MYTVELLVRGRIDADWSDWMAGLRITYPAPAISRLAGSLPDQPALYAVISRLAALNLELIAVHCAPEAEAPVHADAR
ncbi:MAG: hypothetical protein ACPL8I_12995 [Chloroflexaceae bacterium]